MQAVNLRGVCVSHALENGDSDGNLLVLTIAVVLSESDAGVIKTLPNLYIYVMRLSINTF
jgi:hypothetical protein